MGFDETIATTSSAALLVRLRELRRQEESVDVESARARRDWLEVVDDLLRAIRVWLGDAASEGLARVDSAAVHVDDDTGAYDAPALRIGFPSGRVVWVRPAGTLQIGAQGLVDVVCGSNRALLLLNRAGVWKIRPPAPTATLALLDEQSFAAAVQELLA